MKAQFRKVLFLLLTGLAPYWLMNAIVWIPWVYLSRTIGIIIMVLLVPILWGFSAFYCYKHIPFDKWRKERWLISIIFLVSSSVSDVFFFLIWRHLPLSELYHPTTFASYALIVIIPLVVDPIAAKFCRKDNLKLTYNWVGLIAFLLLFIVITLYCVRFW
jgi:hypothetical protein